MTYTHRVLGILASLALACGSNNAGDGDGGVGAPDADNRSCLTANNCSDGQVCDPTTMTCVDDLSCTMDNECGQGGFCNPSGQCEENVTGGPCDSDARCPDNQMCIGGFCGCNGDQFLAEGVPPNLMIVLDRSGSMDESGGGGTKWDIAVAAVGTLLADFGNSIRFGLVLYQDPTQPAGSCAPGEVEVDIGDMTEAAINTELSNTGPDGSTPIGDTLDGLVSYAGLEDTTRDNYILLLTDGDERCGGDGAAAAGNLAAKTPPVKTFVVGFGSGVDAAELNAMAMAGGTALPGGPPFYYQANDAASLQMVFDDIGSSVLSCTYNLSGTPNPDDIFVRFDGQDVPRDPTHTNGWDYDETTNQITFYGAACDSLRDGVVMDLVIVSGCVILVP